MKFVSYIRVSTDKQGDSRLGIEAQQRINKNYIQSIGGELIREEIEIETGTNKTRISIKGNINLEMLLKKRPVLKELIEFCQKEKATLVVKDLSRLGRNQLLISYLMQAGINFVCADAPSDSPFILQIRTAVYEEEARLISRRTIEALQSKKSRGEKLGNLETLNKFRHKQALKKKQESIDYYEPLHKRIIRMRKQKISMQKIAEEFNADGLKTRQGKFFTPATVQRIIKRMPKENAKKQN